MRKAREEGTDVKWPGRMFRALRGEVLVLLAALPSRRTPRKVKGIVLAAMLYLISPVDILPDAIPLAGVLDDVFVVPTLLGAALRLLPPGVRQDSEARAARVRQKAPLLLGLASLLLLLWLGLILRGAWALWGYLTNG